uniref:Uncharacterized protein n=1 Tax=Anguilla anguilla TaxID=7936 RepID=A0A0E9RLS0_ANGAN
MPRPMALQLHTNCGKHPWCIQLFGYLRP